MYINCATETFLSICITKPKSPGRITRLTQQITHDTINPLEKLLENHGVLRSPCARLYGCSQLGTLSNAAKNDGFATAALNRAVNDPDLVFSDHVITNLQNIIDHLDDATGVQNAVNDINFFRWCNVLKDADLLWTNAVLDQNLPDDVPTFAPRPDACQIIDCSATAQCDLLNNGDF